jgi:integrase
LPTKKLTDLFVERAKPPASGRIEYFDASFPGLALRITEKGAKSWCAFYRYHGRLRRFTIGSYPAVKPAAARTAAQAALERVRNGVDPAVEKRARRNRLAPELDTFGALVDNFLERHAKPNYRESTFLEAKRDLEREALRAWRNRPLSSISRRDVIDLVDKIVARGAGVQANRTLARLRKVFNWAIEKDRLEASPIARMKKPTQERARNRALSDDELRWFWQACDKIGWPFGPLFKLLLLTAQRRDEVASLTWPELDIDNRLWTMPREKAKNDRAHLVQLSEAARAVLKDLRARRSPRRGGRGLIFSTTGDTVVSGFSRAKRRLDAAMLEAKRGQLGKRNGDGIPGWTLHDLRRTAATGMAKLKIPPHVVDKILNHVSGTITGVAAVYNQFEYIDERCQALEAWSCYVEAVTGTLTGGKRASN